MSDVAEKISAFITARLLTDPSTDVAGAASFLEAGIIDSTGVLELVQFLEKTCGRASGTVAFGTEAPSMIALGADAVVFGPGDIRVAHRTGEFVPVDQLNDSVRILQRAIEHFCM